MFAQSWINWQRYLTRSHLATGNSVPHERFRLGMQGIMSDRCDGVDVGDRRLGKLDPVRDDAEGSRSS